jgi:hypothetical protein
MYCSLTKKPEHILITNSILVQIVRQERKESVCFKKPKQGRVNIIEQFFILSAQTTYLITAAIE